MMLPVAAQQSNIRQIYEEAEEYFNIGRIEQAASLLNSNIDKFEGGMRSSAYRLIALCHLAQDQDAEAETAVTTMLNEDPYFTPSAQDPMRFIDMVSRLKSGRMKTITTASKLAETIEDAPVPVTLITEEMIKNSTARNLLELLHQYVPGVHILEGEEANFSMRGISSYTQEDVLIMLNGVRLNSYCTNSIAPDYRIALNNIKQIEVLRGAASSLYGNVALSAVVNIITKDGSEVDGLKASIGAGNEHAVKGEVLLGKQFLNSNILIWSSLYSSYGYRHDIKANDPNDAYGVVPIDGYIYVNGYNNKPTYNAGMIYKWRNLKLQLNHFTGKRVYSYSNMWVPSLYDYDRFSTIRNMKPGREVSYTDLNIQYQKSWKDLILEAGVTANYEHTSLYSILGDLPSDAIIPQDNDEYADYSPVPDTEGSFLTQSWRNYNMSGVLKLMCNYNAGKLGHGDILIGGQYDYFKLYYNDMSSGELYDSIVYTAINKQSYMISNNHEINFSFYGQMKHSFNPHLILNVGLRYDHKERFVKSSKKVFSPRAAFIWKPNKKISLKASYSRSFVDAPFFYRASPTVYYGDTDLTPQYLDNVQLTGMFKLPSLHLEFETNAFYSHMKDIINFITNSYNNSSSVRLIGLENILTYKYKDWMVRGTLYAQKILDSEGSTADDDEIFSVPNMTAHLQMSKLLFKDFRVIANLSYSSQCNTVLYEYAYQFGEFVGGDERSLPAYCIVDCGAMYQLKNFEFAIKCKNLFNTKYRLGGDRTPVLQEGRNFMATITMNLSD